MSSCGWSMLLGAATASMWWLGLTVSGPFIAPAVFLSLICLGVLALTGVDILGVRSTPSSPGKVHRP